MVSTFGDKDIVLIRRTKNVQRFDLVAFMQGKEIQVRRVIGLPKEQVCYKNDNLFIQNEPIDEKFIVDEINESQRNGGNFTDNFQLPNQLANGLPEDTYFVLGDNRPYATDSRIYGVIRKEKIIGVVKIQLAPINEWKIF